MIVYLQIILIILIFISRFCPGGKSEEIPFTTSAKQVLEDSVICAQERGVTAVTVTAGHEQYHVP